MPLEFAVAGSDDPAAALAPLVEVWQALLATHVKDWDGRCSGCRWQTRPADRWPCDLYLVAAAAQRLASAQAPRPLIQKRPVDPVIVREMRPRIDPIAGS
jgi:hypothetical protein